jgi:perosamine synthetase
LDKINQIQPWIDNQEASYLKKVVLKSFLTENKETLKFERNIKKKFKLKNCLSVNNWTSGIFMFLKIINIKPGDEVIVPNITFIATATPVLWLGAKIVLCDVDLNNFCIDLDKLSKLITSRTKCIIPVHLYGHCCDLDKLKKIIDNRNIYVLEDAAQAIGAKYKNKFLGNHFDFGGYSFYGNKIITTGEGGVIIFQKKKFLKKLYALKNHGREIKGIFKHKSVGYNFMFTEMQAAVGNIQLRKLDKILNKKKKIFDFYKSKLSCIEEIKFMTAIKENKPVYWFSNIITKKKNALKKYLNNQNIQTRDMFLPLNRQPCFKKSKYIKNINSRFTNSEKIFKEVLSLPSSYNLTTKELMYIVNKIKYFFKKKI